MHAIISNKLKIVEGAWLSRVLHTCLYHFLFEIRSKGRLKGFQTAFASNIYKGLFI